MRLNKHCQHQIIHGKINISVPPPPPYKQKIWYYARDQKDQIKSAIENADWSTISFFCGGRGGGGLDVDDITELFKFTCNNIFGLYIPDKVIKCHGRDRRL